MNPATAKQALKQYGQMGAKLDVNEVNSHRLIQMLMDGALEKIAVAKGHMERGEIKEKGNFISWAISIIEGLRASLDFEKGGDIATNLEALYDYMQRRLVEANIENDLTMLDEVSDLMKSIKSAWDNIGDAGNPQQNPAAEQVSE